MFLIKKYGKKSKSAFWFFMVMAPVVIVLWVVAIRLALIPDDLFTEALISGGGFTGIVTLIISRLYVKRKEQDNGHYFNGEDTADLSGAGYREYDQDDSG